jgi:hypothetical protein
MKLSRLILVVLILGSFDVALATETDQFTTPKAPLHDIGPMLSRKVVEIIEADRTGADPEQILSKWVGRNIFSSRLTRWVKESAGPQVGFRPAVTDSIYGASFSPIPGSFLFNSPTVNLHGYYLGTDKIDHFFRQGHEYFTLAIKKDIATAVAHGVKQEHTYLGTLTSGVYSNADLAANYAGMKFYFSLPALFEPTSEGWRLRRGIDPDRLLEPFLSHHLNESLNPSRYRFSRAATRSRIRERCDAWTRFYTGLIPSKRTFAVTWFGEDYGHWLPPADEVSIATECAVLN